MTLSERWKALIGTGKAHWMPGMISDDGSILVRIAGDQGTFVVDEYVNNTSHRPTPMFDVPATLGCLISLVREAWNDPQAWVEPRWDKDGDVLEYIAWTRPGAHPGAATPIASAESEVEALLKALEAKP